MYCYRLFWKDQELGFVGEVDTEFPWISGNFVAPEQAEAFRDFFDFLTSDEPGDPPFDDNLLDETNWWLLDDLGKRHEISLPAIRMESESISWRWR